MRTNNDTMKTRMDRRLSFLDSMPSCRAKVFDRIAREERPAPVRKKFSLALSAALVLALLSAAALAANLLFSPRVNAARIAERAMAEKRGVTMEMMTFFGREEEELADGTVRVTYSGAGDLNYALGTYTVLVKDGRAEIAWSRDGEDTSGGYEAEAWGKDQLAQMLSDCLDTQRKSAFLRRAAAIAEAHGAAEDVSSSEWDESWPERLEADKTAAMQARRLPEEDLIAIGRKFIVENYSLSEAEAGLMELYTGSGESEGNSWYDMVNGKPCLKVEYLLYAPYTTQQMINGEPRPHMDKEGYYNVYVNVKDGTVEEYEHDSGLGGEG
ncbi:MAG: hypothetical protein IKP22_13750 [Clostridia bacterium]|nr:hypothetical protein [Clostridia bacterium]